MQLNKLTEGVSCELMGNDKLSITGLTINSKACKKGSLFFCLEGENFDGHEFADEAVKKGAVAIVCTHEIKHLTAAQIIVSDTRAAMSLIAKNFFGRAADTLKIIAITGTNGKTTTTFLIKSILEQAGHRVGLIGTTANYIGKIMLPPKLTTPDPIELHELFKKMQDAGCTHVVMEASAHAIFLNKLCGIVFETAVLTNITQDHMDFFGTFENYKNTKIGFFCSAHCKTAVLNAGANGYIAEAKAICDVPFLTYAISAKQQRADCMAKDIKLSVIGTTFNLSIEEAIIPINLGVAGLYNVENALAAACACRNLGFSTEQIKNGLDNAAQVPGRFNVVETPLACSVIVDYAHTPDGLEKILKALSEICKNNIICVFGCGGNRDATKRASMGKIASTLADYVIVTSDNPRFEKPEDITKDIEDGIIKDNYEIVVDRRAAIERALNYAKAGDVVLIAGKGCEDYQEINGIKHPFLDALVVAESAQKIVVHERDIKKTAGQES